jgi:hypothetical protein
MKSIYSLSTSGRSLGLFLLLILAGGAYAGPGPQYWQQAQLQHGQNAAVAPAAEAVAAMPGVGCSKCTTQAVQQFSSSNSSGKSLPHYTTVGTKHTCDMCGGTITTINGKTSNEMMENCPICAKTSPNCCTAKS